LTSNQLHCGSERPRCPCGSDAFVSNTTNIVKFPQKKLLARTKTKIELTVYLAKKILHVIPANLCFVSAFGNRCTGSEQEERDTYLLLHALDATKAGQQAFVSAV